MAALCALSFGDVTRAHAATFTVTSLADTGGGVCSADCTLRQAINAAQYAAGEDTIEFVVAGTIRLSGNLPNLYGPVTIRNAQSEEVAISGDVNADGVASNGDVHIFLTLGNDLVTIENLTLRDGFDSEYDGAIAGGIYNNGTVSLINCTLTRNRAERGGGAIYNNGGNLSLLNCTFFLNSTAGDGGALYTDGNLTATGCTFSDNLAGHSGGAIFTYPFIPNRFTLLRNCTLSRNTAGSFGGALNNIGGQTTIENCTITANKALFYGGSGIYASDNYRPTYTIVNNSIIAGNIGLDGLSGNDVDLTSQGRNFFISGGYNLIGKGSAASAFSTASDRTGLTAAELKIGPLADNDGPTKTHALLDYSPAFNVGSTDLMTDQRGQPRPFGSSDDIGAFESQVQLQQLILDLNGAAAGTSITTAFTEQTPVVIAPGVIITTNATSFSSASVQLNQNVDNASEMLSATVAGTQITTTYNAATLTLSLNGFDTVEHYRQVLASVTYNNTGDTPNTTNRTVVFSITGNADNSSNAAATLAVNAVNDAPVAEPQTLSTRFETPLALTLTGSDIDTPAANLAYSIVTAPANGTLSGSAPNLTYTPNANFSGADSFTFKINDGAADSNVATIALQVLASTAPPIANSQSVETDEDTPLAIVISGNETNVSYQIVTQPAHGTLSGGGPNLIYTPEANFNGSDAFTFQLTNANGQSNIATVSLTVRPVDDPPTANADQYILILGDASQAQQAGVTLQANGIFFVKAPGLLANDRNPVGGDVKARLARAPGHGRIKVNVDGSFFYLPNAGFVGVDEFIYQLDNGQGIAFARVRLTVIDKRVPELRLDTPANRATVKAVAKIAGRVRDRESGVKSVTLLWRRFDGAYWNGSAWTGSAVELPLRVQGINWIYEGKLPVPGDNRVTDLLDGVYDLRATATDNSGNINQMTNRITIKNPPTASTVRFSSATASATQGAIVLNFTGALDAASAGNVANYRVGVNNVAVRIGTATYANNSVTLGNFNLSADDKVTVQIGNLRDADGKTIAGGTIQLVAR